MWVLCCPEPATGLSTGAPPAHPAVSQWVAGVSHSARRRHQQRVIPGDMFWYDSDSADELLVRLPDIDVVVFSPLSLNSLAKMALGIRDSLPSQVFGAAVEQGCSILLDRSALPAGDSSMNPHLIKVYRRHWETLIGGSIAEYVPDSFDQRIKRILRTLRENPLDLLVGDSGRQVITRDDVLAARDGIGRLKIGRGSLVTDLAREEAEKWGIVLECQ